MAVVQLEILTIGYEGTGAGELIAALRAARVATLVDVRDVPWSRRHEFAKRPLSEALARHGIGYRHLKGLGNPKAGRDAARAGDLAAYRAIFAAHLDSATARADLAAAAEMLGRECACLMCYERDPARCHRAIVAERLAALTGLAVRHLVVAGEPAGDSEPFQPSLL